ncbi:triose-phosphate isomerase [Neorhizobium sp. JUb45]|uniref:triose-phosphate isomerase n=1 Tax=unclassified Neorhizobium TaxID=2629175 RepID=UPI0010509C37|nr:triose-phosphate isomerase [Neorhizobium sp. JUb45]TCR02854.1 triosephosphate isomerase [Neorhizobium sp. JUb45]
MSEQIRPLIAGNWKMNGLAHSLSEIALIAEGVDGYKHRLDTLICPPTTLLAAASTRSVGTALVIGAQDCSGETHGAYTGDVSAAMVADSGGRAVIVGHSERRQGRQETDADVKRKAERAMEAGLQVIICIGETEEEMLKGATQDVLLRQLQQSVPAQGTAGSVVIAYEPVWAIGTGRTPSIDAIAKLHSFIRSSIIVSHGDEGSRLRILYGGSVKADNAAEIARIDHVNGALVGGASLKSSDFLSIVNAF